MRLRELIESKTPAAPKVRNFVAKHAAKTTTGAGQHKDMKRAEKQGNVKHKKDLVPMEGWSDAMVARRTGGPRTPYSVYIKGKKWKDFENDDHAEAVANKLKAKFKADGRDPTVITIAPTEIITGEATALEKFRKAADEREKKHDAAEKEIKARHARGEEDMKGSIDRLAKMLDKDIAETATAGAT
jgi:hypothetical protein